MSIREASIQITAEEHRARCQKLIDYMKKQEISGAVLFDQDYVLYYSGFAFVATERPMAFVMNVAGERRLFVPRLELEHAQANAVVESVDHYLEYPDDPHPTEVLKGSIKELGIEDRIGADQDGYPWIFGYRGPVEGIATTMTTTTMTAIKPSSSPIRMLVRLSLRYQRMAP